MTKFKAITIRDYGVDYREFRNVEAAEAYEMWIREEHPTAEIRAFGEVSGDEYVVVYYLRE